MSIKFSDIVKETKKWFELPEFPGFKIELKLLKNQELERLYNNCTDKAGKIDTNKLYQNIATFIISNVEGLVDDDGKAIIYDAEKGYQLLNDPLIGKFIIEKISDAKSFDSLKNVPA